MSIACTPQRPSIKSKSLSRSRTSTPGCSLACQPLRFSRYDWRGDCARARRRRSLAVAWSVRPSSAAFFLIWRKTRSSIIKVVLGIHKSVAIKHKYVKRYWESVDQVWSQFLRPPRVISFGTIARWSRQTLVAESDRTFTELETLAGRVVSASSDQSSSNPSTRSRSCASANARKSRSRVRRGTPWSIQLCAISASPRRALRRLASTFARNTPARCQ